MPMTHRRALLGEAASERLASREEVSSKQVKRAEVIEYLDTEAKEEKPPSP